MPDSTSAQSPKKLMPVLVRVKRILLDTAPPIAEFDAAALKLAAERSLTLGGFHNVPVLKRDGENYRVISGYFECYAAMIAREIDPIGGELIPAFVVESQDEQIAAALRIAHFNYPVADRQTADHETLSQVQSTIWEITEALVTVERALYNIEACEQYWDSELNYEQVFNRLNYLHGRFWDEIPKGGMTRLNHKFVNFGRLVRSLLDFAGEGDK